MPHRPLPEQSTRPEWEHYAEEHRRRAARHLVAAGRLLELIPDDADAGRAAAWCFRWAARITERVRVAA